MLEGTMSKLCPLCRALSPAAASSCFRCGFSFSTPVGGSTRVSIRLVVSTMTILFLALVLAAVFGLHALVTSTQAYQQAIALAQSSPGVQRALGNGISPRFPAVGFVAATGGSEFTEFSIRVVGSQTSG
jgi:hypothetical protein